ncbi:MAG: phosphoribosylglycinamide formyltransferase [Pseudomonadota bacterium]
MSGSRKRVAVLISGRGSNMEALIKAASAPHYPADIVVVISNNPDAPGLGTASKAGIATAAVNHRDYATKSEFEAALHEALNAHAPDLVCLAGFMRLLSADFVAQWHNRILNIHPSLLPAFKGLNTHQRALDAGVKLAGCTVHIVRPEMDDGPIIAQATVPVVADDTADTLAARILVQEHRLYPHALALMASGVVRIDGDLAQISESPAETETAALIAPPPVQSRKG